MDKKRFARASGSRKAQITIFLILGLVLLMVFLFLLYLTNTVVKSRLGGEQERVLLQAFQKEALRIYLDDCLTDELETGLILLGKQGRLWDDQPGGRKFFEEGRTGIMLNPQEKVQDYFTGRVAYALTNESLHYFQNYNAYPCNDESFSPAFCRYAYPDTAAGFGLLQLRSSVVEGDLQRFLEKRTLACVTDWLRSDISRQAELQQEKIELQTRFHSDGIGLTARYPLRFKVGRQEFFHLTNFDFFYPTSFTRLFDVAAFYPASWDQKFVDFNYTEATLQSPMFRYGSLLDLGDCIPSDNYFLCSRGLQVDVYRLLSLQLSNYSTPSGDDIFEFTAPIDSIIRNQPYTLRLARQNRPPALSYLHRRECLERQEEEFKYDYLIVKEHEAYGDLNLIAQALDPDEDVVQYGFTAPSGMNPATGYPENNFYVPKDSIQNLPEGLHLITATAYDGHQLVDWQVVRTFIDRNIDTTLTLESPYTDISYQLGENRYIVSREDPAFMRITIPLLSADPAAAALEEVDFTYNDQQGGLTAFSLPDRRTLPNQQQFCYNLPVSVLPQMPAHCLLSSYTASELEQLDPSATSSNLLHPFRKTTLPLTPGKLTLGYTVDYCGNLHLEDQTEVEVTVAECVPHRNPAYPYPYLTAADDPERHYQWKFPVKADGTTDFAADYTVDQNVNPFDVTHSCCQGDPAQPSTWKAAPAEQVCFTNPAVGCYGKAEGVIGNYVLETVRHFCDGQSGNRCGGPTYVLNNDQLRCGKNSDHQCKDIALQCQEAYSFYLVDTDFDGKSDGWCHGEMGCKEFCGVILDANGNPDGTKAVVYLGDDYKASYGLTGMNLLAKNSGFTSDAELSFGCGCTGHNGKKCDADFDGQLDETCVNGKCQFVCGPPNSIYCDGNDVKQCNSQATGSTVKATCIPGQYCDPTTIVTDPNSASNKCKIDQCTADTLACFTDLNSNEQTSLIQNSKSLDKFTGMNDPAISAELKKNVYACQKDGSGWDVAAVCGSPCGANTHLVDMNSQGFSHPADGEYACGCSLQTFNKPCLWKGSGEIGTCPPPFGSCTCPLPFGQSC